MRHKSGRYSETPLETLSTKEAGFHRGMSSHPPSWITHTFHSQCQTETKIYALQRIIANASQDTMKKIKIQLSESLIRPILWYPPMPLNTIKQQPPQITSNPEPTTDLSSRKIILVVVHSVSEYLPTRNRHSIVKNRNFRRHILHATAGSRKNHSSGPISQ